MDSPSITETASRLDTEDPPLVDVQEVIGEESDQHGVHPTILIGEDSDLHRDEPPLRPYQFAVSLEQLQGHPLVGLVGRVEDVNAVVAYPINDEDLNADNNNDENAEVDECVHAENVEELSEDNEELQRTEADVEVHSDTDDDTSLLKDVTCSSSSEKICVCNVSQVSQVIPSSCVLATDLPVPLSLSTSEDQTVYLDSANAFLVGSHDARDRVVGLLEDGVAVDTDEGHQPSEFRSISWIDGQVNLTVSYIGEPSASLVFPKGVFLLAWDFHATRSDSNMFQALEVDVQRMSATVYDIAKHNPGSVVLLLTLLTAGTPGTDMSLQCTTAFEALTHYTRECDIYLHENVVIIVNEADATAQKRRISKHLIEASSKRFGLGKPVSEVTLSVLKSIRRLRTNHKILLVSQLLADVDFQLSFRQVSEALGILSVAGVVMYWGGCDQDDKLATCVVLDAFLLLDVVRMVISRDMMEHLRKSLERNTDLVSIMDPDDCMPLLRPQELHEIVSCIFKGECVEKVRPTADSAGRIFLTPFMCAPYLYIFFEQLFVRRAILRPITDSSSGSTAAFFVAALLEDDTELSEWSFDIERAFMTKLAYSWDFERALPPSLMADLTVAVIREMYKKCCESTQNKPLPSEPQVGKYGRQRPLISPRVDSNEEFERSSISVLDLKSWKSSFAMTIDSKYIDKEKQKEHYAPIHIYVHIVDAPFNSQSLVVCCEGLSGRSGRQIWNGGFRCVFDTIWRLIAPFKVKCSVKCPDCLEHGKTASASSWLWKTVESSARKGIYVGPCIKQKHRVDSWLLTGIERPQDPRQPVMMGMHKLGELKQSIVMVGLWNFMLQSMRNLGSGFIVDAKQGLVFTAKHTLFGMKDQHFKYPYHGLTDVKVVVGVIPGDGRHPDDASLRYFAEIIPDDRCDVDACLIKITGIFKDGVDKNGKPISALDDQRILSENLRALKIGSSARLGEAVCIIGFPQGGEGRFAPGSFVDCSVDLAHGYICRYHKAPLGMPLEHSDCSFTLQDEIVAVCPTIDGHSGSPFLNNEGEAVAMLSSADNVERQRCYLVPAPSMRFILNEGYKTLALARQCDNGFV